MDKVISIIKNCNSEGTLFVVKGFDIELYGGEKVNLANVISNKVGRVFQLVSKKSNVISFEEFISLFDLVISQYRKIIILENPELLKSMSQSSQKNSKKFYLKKYLSDFFGKLDEILNRGVKYGKN